MKLLKYKPSSETELHNIIENHLDEFENELKMIKHEFIYRSERPDFLCIDKEGRLVVIEVKVDSDKYVIFQIIRYFEMVNQNKYLIQKTYPTAKIDPEKDIRNIIIAGEFTEETKNIVQYLEQIGLELYTYKIFKSQDGKDEGIVFEYVDTPISIPQAPLEHYTPDIHEKYLANERLRETFNEILKTVKEMNINIESKKHYVAFKFKGKNIGEIRCARDWIWLISWEYSDEGREKKAIKIERGDENKNEIYSSLKNSQKLMQN